MKKFRKTLIILVVIPLFVFAGLICCCFESKVEASEPAATCHSMKGSPQDNGASHSDEDCGCMHKDHFLTKKDFPVVKLVTTTFTGLKDILMPHGVVSEALHSPVQVLATQAPPKASVYSLPIYIKNSNLRL